MAVTFELPEILEADLRTQFKDFDHTIKEMALIELYRLDRITQHVLGVALNLSRFGVEALLKQHNVTEDLLTVEEYQASLEHLRRITTK